VLPKGTRLTGFYSYGELSPFATGRCDLHNQTMTLTTFSESATPVMKAPPPVAAVQAPAPVPVPPPMPPAIAPVAPQVPRGIQLESFTYEVKSGRWSAPFPTRLDSPRTLVLAFGDTGVLDAPEPLKELRRAFPTSIVAGCSGSGEIVGTTVRDEVITVTVTRFTNTTLAAASGECREAGQSFAVGESVGRRLAKPGLKAVFVLSDGLNVNGSELVRGINACLDDSVVVTGGLAGDGTRFQRTWVSFNDTVSSGMVVAIGFYGDHLQVSHGSKGGWDKFGPERIVTRSEGNVLCELDGKPALTLYKEYLGEKASGLPATGLLFPLSLRASARDDKALVRTLLAVDEAKQSLTFAGDLPTGSLAQMMKADFDRLITGAASAATTARKLASVDDPNTLAIAVSCVGRRLVLGERTEEEVEAVLDVLPKGTRLTGFYSYGELSPFATGRCDLHNQTMTLTTFSESAAPVARVPAPLPQPVASAPMPPPAGLALTPMPSAPPTGSIRGLHEAPAPKASTPAAPTLATARLSRLAATDRTASAAATVEVDRSGDVPVVRIKGKLSEAFKGRDVSAVGGAKLVMDLSDVERVTSFGVREWLQMLSELEGKGTQLYYVRCSEAVVNQLGMIRRFAGQGQVLSFFAPYQCSGCGARYTALIDCAGDALVLKQKALPTTECPSCGEEGHFDDDARSYLAFGPQAPQELPIEVRRVVEALPGLKQQDPIEKSIEGRVNRVRVNCRLDDTVRWARVLDGLEGELVLDLGGSTGSTPEGLTALVTALGRLPTEVESIQLEACPGSLLEALAKGRRDRRVKVLTAAVEGQCATCATHRPATVRVEETLASGGELYAICKKCNAQLDFSRLKPTLQALTAAPAPEAAPAVSAAPAPVAPAPMAVPAVAPPPVRAHPALLLAALLGVLIVALLLVLVLKPAPAPVVVAAPPPSVAVAEPTPVVAPAVAAPVALPPSWTEQPFTTDKDGVALVARVSGAASEDDALKQARAEAEFAMVQRLLEGLAGTRTAEFVSARGTTDWAANREPIVARFERQLGSVAAPQRSEVALRKAGSTFEGAVQYRVTKDAWDKALETYRATSPAFGLSVARLFPGLEASVRTDGELVVLSAGRGLGWRAGVKDGDVILALDGRPTPTLEVFTRLVRESAAPGVTLALTVETAGTRRVVRVAIPKPTEDSQPR
jgi:hypothetical protein